MFAQNCKKLTPPPCPQNALPSLSVRTHHSIRKILYCFFVSSLDVCIRRTPLVRNMLAIDKPLGLTMDVFYGQPLNKYVHASFYALLYGNCNQLFAWYLCKKLLYAKSCDQKSTDLVFCGKFAILKKAAVMAVLLFTTSLISCQHQTLLKYHSNNYCYLFVRLVSYWKHRL